MASRNNARMRIACLKTPAIICGLGAVALVLLACDQSSSSTTDAAGEETEGGDAGLESDGDRVGADGTDLIPETRPPADDIVRACAKMLACLNPIQPSTYGLGNCVRDMYRLLGSELERQSYLFMSDDGDFMAELALLQNLDCALAAPDCAALQSCLDVGTVAASCTPPAGFGKRWCADGTHLRGCSLGAEVTFDCAALGLPCQELAIGSSRFASCSQPGNLSAPTFEVACDGDWATLEAWGGKFVFSCGYVGGSCVAGSYADLGENGLAFCQGTEPATCTDGPPRCDGHRLIRCLGGREAATDCGRFQQTCLATAEGAPYCGFLGCTTINETCTGTAVGFCGPVGPTTVDCAALGLTGCAVASSYYPNSAWCSW